ncbi:hypothetical protein [Bacillus cereus group sp. BfR-BA-01358]|uniref:hypothetical protein n=1 Tax=Bacillus cereus group sp. BfR-BA-01358 TaxID=2920320 RepID=UPI001F55D4A8|nr:hypothetical protein [Bacillus cereus group sp. BfR-BA-01358]
MSYQVRISLETAELLEELKLMYENNEKSSITKGEVLVRSYYDSKWVEDWQKIHEKKIKLKNDYEIKPNALRPRLEITNEVEEGIKNLKLKIAEALGLRSVTVGVVIKLILKASFIKNTDSVSNADIVQSIFQKYKEQIIVEFDNDMQKRVLTLVNNIEEDLKGRIENI